MEKTIQDHYQDVYEDYQRMILRGYIRADSFERMALDPKKYRGKGRPRKDDYTDYLEILNRDGQVFIKKKDLLSPTYPSHTEEV